MYFITFTIVFHPFHNRISSLSQSYFITFTSGRKYSLKKHIGYHFYNCILSLLRRADNIAKKTYRDVCYPGQLYSITFTQLYSLIFPSGWKYSLKKQLKKHIGRMLARLIWNNLPIKLYSIVLLQLYFINFTTVFHSFSIGLKIQPKKTAKKTYRTYVAQANMKHSSHSIVCNCTFTIVFNHFYNSIPSFFHRAENIAKKNISGRMFPRPIWNILYSITFTSGYWKYR